MPRGRQGAPGSFGAPLDQIVPKVGTIPANPMKLRESQGALPKPKESAKSALLLNHALARFKG
jgi:hypothetical protein